MSVTMRRKLLAVAVALAAAAVPATGRAQATIGALTKLPFGLVQPNPTGIKMSYYVPTSGHAPMPIVLGLHGCQGDETQVMGFLKDAADKYGFMLVVPFVNRVDANAAGATGCWDVGSADALALPPNNKSDPAALYALINYVGTTLKCGSASDAPVCGDLGNVYATGQSSGAMMTNVMLGLYPDLFKAGASYMGVPFGCWAAGVGGSAPGPGDETHLGKAAGWSNDCANGVVKHDAAGWAALLPAHTGAWPRMQIIHGENDTLINYANNFTGQVQQWTGARGLTDTPDVTDYPVAPSKRIWTRTRYGGTGPQPPVEAIHIKGMGHDPMTAEVTSEIVRFFGLGDSTAPSAPADLVASNVAAAGVTLAWTASTDNEAVWNYVVLANDGTTTTAVFWPKTTPASVVGLKPSTHYTITVVAADEAGNLSPASNAVTVDTTADTTAPTAVTNLSAASITDTSASLKWTAATDDVGVTGYVVSRKDGDSWTQVATPTASPQALSGLTAGTSYTFQVVAKDAAGHASPATTVTFTTTGGSSSGGGGGGGGCGQGVPSGAALLLAAAALLWLRRRAVRA